jgi:hypothetical protein
LKHGYFFVNKSFPSKESDIATSQARLWDLFAVLSCLARSFGSASAALA